MCAINPSNFFEIRGKRRVAAFRKAEEANREAQRGREPFDLSKIKWSDDSKAD